MSTDPFLIYRSPPHDCSYLPTQQSSSIFIDPKITPNTDTYAHLIALGFRRSGDILYRPACQDCSACMPLRVKVAEFSPSRRFKRLLKLNSDIVIKRYKNHSFQNNHYSLFERYIAQLHNDGDMHPTTKESYSSFLLCKWSPTEFWEFQLNGRLVGIAVTDVLPTALSSVYTFYEPSLNKRSLGTFAILQQILKAAEQNLDYLYMGYWIEDCRKMAYKNQFKPNELFHNNSWY